MITNKIFDNQHREEIITKANLVDCFKAHKPLASIGLNQYI